MSLTIPDFPATFSSGSSPCPGEDLEMKLRLLFPLSWLDVLQWNNTSSSCLPWSLYSGWASKLLSGAVSEVVLLYSELWLGHLFILMLGFRMTKGDCVRLLCTFITVSHAFLTGREWWIGGKLGNPTISQPVLKSLGLDLSLRVMWVVDDCSGCYFYCVVPSKYPLCFFSMFCHTRLFK